MALPLENVVESLQQHQTALHQLGVSHLYVFGSVAWGEAKENSDIDLFFDYEDASFSLIEFIKVQDKISAILRTKIDITTRRGLHPLMRNQIEADAFRIF